MQASLRLTLMSVLMAAFTTAHAGQVLRTHKGDLKTDQLVSLMGTLMQSKGEFIVQFQSSIGQAEQSLLKSWGLRILRYLPDDALVVQGDVSSISALQLRADVNAVVPYSAHFRAALNLPQTSVFSMYRQEPIVVLAFTQEDANRIATYLSSQAELVEHNGRVLSAQASHAVIDDLLNMRGVEHVQIAEPIIPMHMTFDDSAVPAADPQGAGDYSDFDGFEAGTKLIKMEHAWSAGFTGAGQTVAVADTGLDTGNAANIHADFAGSIVKGVGFGIGARGDWSDPMGHGTHVAGSVMGSGAESGGALRGAGYGAGVIPQGMWSPLINNLTVPPRLSTLFLQAYEDGARIHTNSWGSPRNLGVYDAMAQQVDEFTFANQDFLILFAAGNSGLDSNRDGVIDLGSVSSPGTAKNSLTVGASENLTSLGGIQRQVRELRDADTKWPVEPISSSKLSDNANGIAVFSSRGPTRDGRLKPEVVAPGTNILSARSAKPGASEMWGAYNNKYVWSGGTSMSTPLVAGASAVVREALVRRYEQQNPSAALVKATLMNTAFDLFPGQYGQGPAQELNVRPDNNQGYGRVDMQTFINAENSLYPIDNKVGVGTGEEAVYELALLPGRSLTVNLVWMDAPGSPSSAKALVNDLDLVVTHNGQVISTSDQINNAELFEAHNLAEGSYFITVRGAQVPMGLNGKQPYALVVRIH